jgi:diaminopimelate decarboxylase
LIYHKYGSEWFLGLQPELWGLNVNDKDHLVIGNCDTIKLVDEYGTPLYIVNKERLRENYNRINTAFKSRYSNVDVYYSYKTNCIPAVLEVLHESGAKAEVISGYELWLALKLGVSPNSIIFNGPNKTDDELLTAIKHEIKLINADSISEIERINKIAGKLGTKANVGIRICPSIVPKGMNPGTATGSKKSHFGVDLESGEALEAFEKAAKANNINLLGMHCHIGSGVKDTKSYVKAAQKLLKLAAEIRNNLQVDIQYLDLGGGYGTPCHQDMSGFQFLSYLIFNRLPPTPNPESCPTIDDFAHKITQKIKESCKEYDLSEPNLILEPGRYLTGDTQVLLLRVGGIKERKGMAKYVLTDGGMFSTSLMVWVEYHKVFVANKMSAEDSEKYMIFGRVCTTADWLYKNMKLPKLEKNDVLAVMDTGAYFTATSSNFSYPRPPILMVKDGKAQIIREAESYDDLIRKDK